MSALLLIGGVLGEALALWALFTPGTATRQMLLFLPCHGVASVCLGLLLTGVLPRRVEVHRRGSLALFFSFSLFIPLLGSLGMLAALIYFRFFLRFQERAEFFTLPTAPFMQEAGPPTPGMGEGGAWSRLRTSALPRSARLKALLAVGGGSGRNASRLLHLATADGDDEIRLLAFHLADQREKVISSSISTALKALREADSTDERRSLHRTLAFSNWEMLFNDLASRDLAGFFLEQAIHHGRYSLELDPNDPALQILMGRLYLWQGDTERAGQAVDAALELGAHRDRVIPYLAELAYRRRDFDQLKRYFEMDPLLRHKPGIGPVIKFWMGYFDGRSA